MIFRVKDIKISSQVELTPTDIDAISTVFLVLYKVLVQGWIEIVYCNGFSNMNLGNRALFPYLPAMWDPDLYF